MQMKNSIELRYEPDVEPHEPADINHLQAQAVRCRRLARSIGDSEMVEQLARLAEDYEAQVQRRKL